MKNLFFIILSFFIISSDLTNNITQFNVKLLLLVHF